MKSWTLNIYLEAAYLSLCTMPFNTEDCLVIATVHWNWPSRNLHILMFRFTEAWARRFSWEFLNVSYRLKKCAVSIFVLKWPFFMSIDNRIQLISVRSETEQITLGAPVNVALLWLRALLLVVRYWLITIDYCSSTWPCIVFLEQLARRRDHGRGSILINRSSHPSSSRYYLQSLFYHCYLLSWQHRIILRDSMLNQF